MMHPTDYPVIPRQYRIVTRAGEQHAAVMMPYPMLHPEDAACTGDERFSDDLEHKPRTEIDNLKAVCMGCPLRTGCAEWGIAHERYGVWGALTPKEREAVRRMRRQIVVEPSTAYVFGMGSDWNAHLNYANTGNLSCLA